MAKEKNNTEEVEIKILELIKGYTLDEMREIIESVSKMIDEIEDEEEVKSNANADYSFGV
jgi:hypothetical protein